MSDPRDNLDAAHWETLDRAWERIVQGQEALAQDTLPDDDYQLLKQLHDAGQLHEQQQSRVASNALRRSVDASSPVTSDSFDQSLERWSGECLGDFELLNPIAQGGMGIVYRARQRSLNRYVAVKLLRSGLFASNNEVRRFQAEATAAAGLHHPGIVAIYSVGQSQGLHYYAMELVQGISLAQLHQQRVTGDRQAALWIKQIAEAVEYAHQNKIVHRDLKPANVLIDEQGNLKVTDFGLASTLQAAQPHWTGDGHTRSTVESSATTQPVSTVESSSTAGFGAAHGSQLTQSGEILGTPAYMSPEQIGGDREHIGPATDVYAIGVILYELLTGKPPFSAASTLDTLKQVVECEPLSPRLVNSAVSRDLATVCLKCLEKRPQDRLASARELVDECERFLKGLPVKTRPIGLATRAWRTCARNPVISLMSSLVLAILVVSSIAGWYVARQLRQANRSAQAAEQLASKNAAAALQQRSLALKTLNEIIASLESELARRPDLLPLRQELMRGMQTRLQAVLDSGHNVDRDASVARAHARLGNLLWLAGDAESAKAQLELAKQIVEPLAARGDSEALSCYAYVLDELGNQQQMHHQLDEARATYSQSLSILEQMLKRPGAGKEDQINTAFAHSRLGDIALLKGQVPEGRTAYQAALTVLQPLFEVAVDDRRVSRLASRCHERLSWTLSALQQFEQASQELESALKSNQQLLKVDGGDHQARVDQCNLLYSQADLQLRLNALSSAREMAQQCVQVGDDLLQNDLRNMELRWSHALHLEQLAKCQRALGEFTAAASSTGLAYDWLARSIADSGKPSAKFFQSLVGVSVNGLQAQMRLGDQAAIHLWAQRVIDAVKQLNPPANEAPLWQVAIDVAKDMDEALSAFDASWQPTDELERLRPDARESGLCVAAYQLIRQNRMEDALPLIRRAAEYQTEHPAIRYTHLTCQALCWGMIAESLKDAHQEEQHTYAIDQAIAALRQALRLNPAGREELKLCPELNYVRETRPDW